MPNYSSASAAKEPAKSRIPTVEVGRPEAPRAVPVVLNSELMAVLVTGVPPEPPDDLTDRFVKSLVGAALIVTGYWTTNGVAVVPPDVL